MEQSDRLFDEGCCLCGATKTVMDFSVNGGDRIKGVPACGPCFRRHGLSKVMIGAEYDRRKSLTRPAPTPEAKAFAVGDRVITHGFSLCVNGPGVITNVLPGGRLLAVLMDDETQRIGKNETWNLSIDQLRPAAPPSPPAAVAEAVKANACMVCLAAIPSDWHACVYCAGRADRERRATVETLAHDLERKRTGKIAALTLDLDRPSVPRRDRLGRELVPWTGWVSTRHAK
jgi:hypothetical protein